MFGRFVRRFLNNIFEPKLTVHTVSKRIDHFCLPFLHCLTLSSNSHSNHPTLQCCLSTSQHSMRLLFLYSHLFFSFKGKVPKFMRSGVLYSFKRQCCSASYVGETTRHLHTRVPENLGISPITGKPSSSPVMSSIFSHLNSTGHSANFDDLEIPLLAPTLVN